MDLAQVGVLRRRCRCTAAGLLQLPLLPALPAWLSAALALGSVVALEEVVVWDVNVDVLAGGGGPLSPGSFEGLSSITDSLTVSRAGWSLGAGCAIVSLEVLDGGPVGPLWVCGAWETPLVRLSMLSWLSAPGVTPAPAPPGDASCRLQLLLELLLSCCWSSRPWLWRLQFRFLQFPLQPSLQK